MVDEYPRVRHWGTGRDRVRTKRIKGAIWFYKSEGLPTIQREVENGPEIMSEGLLARGVWVQGTSILVYGKSRSEIGLWGQDVTVILYRRAFKATASVAHWLLVVDA